MTKKKDESEEKPQGFYVKGAEEGGYKKAGTSTKGAQKQKTGRGQGLKKAKSSARFSEEESGFESEDIEQDQDDQS